MTDSDGDNIRQFPQRPKGVGEDLASENAGTVTQLRNADFPDKLRTRAAKKSSEGGLSFDIDNAARMLHSDRDTLKNLLNALVGATAHYFDYEDGISQGDHCYYDDQKLCNSRRSIILPPPSLNHILSGRDQFIAANNIDQNNVIINLINIKLSAPRTPITLHEKRLRVNMTAGEIPYLYHFHSCDFSDSIMPAATLSFDATDCKFQRCDLRYNMWHTVAISQEDPSTPMFEKSNLSKNVFYNSSFENVSFKDCIVEEPILLAGANTFTNCDLTSIKPIHIKGRMGVTLPFAIEKPELLSFKDCNLDPKLKSALIQIGCKVYENGELLSSDSVIQPTTKTPEPVTNVITPDEGTFPGDPSDRQATQEDAAAQIDAAERTTRSKAGAIIPSELGESELIIFERVKAIAQAKENARRSRETLLKTLGDMTSHKDMDVAQSPHNEASAVITRAVEQGIIDETTSKYIFHIPAYARNQEPALNGMTLSETLGQNTHLDPIAIQTILDAAATIADHIEEHNRHFPKNDPATPKAGTPVRVIVGGETTGLAPADENHRGRASSTPSEKQVRDAIEDGTVINLGARRNQDTPTDGGTSR